MTNESPFGSSILGDKANISMANISKTHNSHQTNLEGKIELQVRGKTCILDFGMNCHCQSEISTAHQ